MNTAFSVGFPSTATPVAAIQRLSDGQFWQFPGYSGGVATNGQTGAASLSAGASIFWWIITGLNDEEHVASITDTVSGITAIVQFGPDAAALASLGTLLTRVSANVALDTDMQTALTNLGTLLTRVSANVALDTDMQTALSDLTSLLTRTLANADAYGDAVLDRADGVETGWTLRQTLRIMSAAVCGVLAGAASASITMRNVTDAKVRVTADVDADGNRTAVVFDAT